MALATMTLDPNAQAYTDNEIVDKVNAASNQITRADAVSYDDLNLVKTGPAVGKHKVKQLDRTGTGDLEVTYDDVAES